MRSTPRLINPLVNTSPVLKESCTWHKISYWYISASSMHSLTQCDVKIDGERNTMSEHANTGEATQDFVNEVADSGEVGEEHPGWHKHVSLVILIMALLSALGAVLAGMTAHQALIERTEEIIELNIMEGDRIYMETLRSKHEILTALGESPDQAEIEAIEAFEKDMQDLETEAAIEETKVITAISTHLIFAIVVALLSLGTALCGMSIIADQKYLWMVGTVFGVIGTIGLGIGVLSMIF